MQPYWNYNINLVNDLEHSSDLEILYSWPSAGIVVLIIFLDSFTQRRKGETISLVFPLLNLLYSNNWQRLTFWYFLRLIFEISLPCWPLHQHAEIKRWVQEQEEAIPEAYTSVHSWEVYVKVLTNTIDNCNSKQWVTIQLGCGPTERMLITQIQ